MNRDELRTAFPHTREHIYLNHAALAPLSRPVVDAMNRFIEQRHHSNIENYFDFQAIVEETTSRLATLLGTEKSRIEFAPNTSYALNILALGLDWQPGDRIAIPACEFPANVYPFMNLQQQGVEVDFIPHHEGTFSLDDIAATLTPNTRLLTLSWVQFLSGFRADLLAVGQLCQEKGVLFCVDAIQGLGALQIDVEACGIDFLACGGHKWMMAIQGIGFLYVRESLQDRLTPMAGWLHGPVDWDKFFDYELSFHPGAERFRLGTMNSLGIAAMHAALGLYTELGSDWCEMQVLAGSGHLREGLMQIGLPVYGSQEKDRASGIVTVRHSNAEKVYQHLKEQGITISLRNRMLRFAPTYYNTAEEIEAVLAAVENYHPDRVVVPT